MILRNLKILKYLISKYPHKNWNIFNLSFGSIINEKYYFDKKYRKIILKNVLIPLEIIIYQLKKNDFNLLYDNSNPSSITSIDWMFSKLILSYNFNITLFLKFFETSEIFQNYIYESDKKLDKKKIYSLLSLKINCNSIILENEIINGHWDLDYLSLNSSLNIDILKKNKNKSWNFDFLLQNKNLTYDWILLFDKNKWNWETISKLKILNFNWIMDNLDIRWNLNNITNSKYFEIEWIYELNLKGININIFTMNLEKSFNFKLEWITILKKDCKYKNYKWNFNKLSKNKNFRLYWLDLYPYKQWDWSFLLKTKNITMNILKKLELKNWNESSLEKNPNFNFNWYLEFPLKNWSSLYYLSSKMDIPIDYLHNNLDKKWNFRHILLYKKLDFNLIMGIKSILNMSDKYFWFLVSNNKYFDFNWLKYYEIEWDFYNGISNLLHLTVNIIEKYKNKKWNIYKIINNSNIVIQDFSILMNLFPQLSISNFSENPNITIQFIENNIDKIDFNLLSKNKLNGLYYINRTNIFKKKKLLKIYEKELIEKSWHPSRFLNWCLDIDKLHYIKTLYL